MKTKRKIKKLVQINDKKIRMKTTASEINKWYKI